MNSPSHRLAIAALLIGLAAPLLAQDARRSDSSSSARSIASTPPALATDLTRGVYLPPIDAEDFSLRRYAGQRVVNTEGAELGTLRDFVVDLTTGRAHYAVISTGGVLRGMGNSLRLVPMEALRRGREPRSFELDILQSTWLQLPPLHDEDYVVDRFGISAEQHQSLLQRFKTAGSSAALGTVGAPEPRGGQPGRLLRATELRGKALRAGDRPVGNIENIVVDVERGTVAALIDSAGEFTGTNGKYLIPLSALQVATPPQNTIQTTLTRVDFDRAQPAQFTLPTSAATATPSPREEPALTPTGRPTAPATR